MTDTLEERLTQVLAARSGDAPPADGLVQAATWRLRRRRRIQGGTAAVAVATVLVPVGLLGLGGGRDHQAPPEPLGPYRYGQHQKVSDAVPAAQARGFRTLDYGVPSHSPVLPMPNGEKLGPVAEYLDIDARGHLLAMRVSPHQTLGPSLKTSYQVVPGAHRAARPVTPPPDDDQTSIWTPSFTPDNRLLWQPTLNIQQGPWIDDRLTDPTGGQLQAVVPPSSMALPSSRVLPSQRNLWVDGGRVWFSAVTRADGASRRQAWVSLFSFDPAHPQQVRREAATDVSDVDVANGTAVWIDRSSTRVFAENLTTREVREVPVPLGEGCRLPPAADLDGGGSEHAVVTNGSLVAVAEYCPDGRNIREVVADLSGRLVTELDPGAGNRIYSAVLSDQTLAFIVQGGEGDTTSYLADLGTGELVDLGRWVPDYNVLPQVAGRYVLWYAGPAGHVGRLAAR